jgi:hypothetical protein
MNMIEEIGGWLKDGGKDFDRGFALLKNISRNPFFMNNIQRRLDIGKVKHELNKFFLRSGGVLIIQNTKLKSQYKEETVNIKQEVKKDGDSFAKAKEVMDRVASARFGGLAKTYKEEGTEIGGEVASPDDHLRDVGFAKTDKKEGTEKRLQRETVVIRKEFPFLGDDDCPVEFKVLVADMITAHAKYVKAHDRLFDVANKDNETCFETAAELVENYIDNRAMWNELEHYKNTGEILGEHRIFDEKKRRDAIFKMNANGLKALRVKLQRKIAYRKRLIKEHRDDERIKEWTDEIKKLEREKRMAEAPRRRMKSG